jgi:hypothetical protein
MRLPRPYRAELDAVLSEPFLYLIGEELSTAVSLNTEVVPEIWTGKCISSTIFSRNKIVLTAVRAGYISIT